MTMVSINKDNRTEIGIYEKAFSIFMALYPLLCIYKGISNFTIGDLILIVFFFVALFKKNNYLRYLYRDYTNLRIICLFSVKYQPFVY